MQSPFRSDAPFYRPEIGRRLIIIVVVGVVLIIGAVVAALTIHPASPDSTVTVLPAPHGTVAYCSGVKRTDPVLAAVARTHTPATAQAALHAIAHLAPLAPTTIADDLSILAAWGKTAWVASPSTPTTSPPRQLAAALSQITTYTNAACHLVFGIG